MVVWELHLLHMIRGSFRKTVAFKSYLLGCSSDARNCATVDDPDNMEHHLFGSKKKRVRSSHAFLIRVKRAHLVAKRGGGRGD